MGKFLDKNGLVYFWSKLKPIISSKANFSYQNEGEVLDFPSTIKYTSIAYGNGRFVAISAGSDRVIYSDDCGEHWSEILTISNRRWKKLRFVNNKFIAVSTGTTNAVAISDDGLSWTYHNMPVDCYWKDITFGNGVYFVMSSNTNNGAISNDGETWTKVTLPNSYWKSACFGGGKFVVLGDSGLGCYSSDASTWTTTTLPSSAAWNSLCYAKGKFVAVAYGYNTGAMYSIDGKGTFVTIASNRSKYALIRLNPCVNGLPFLIADKSN